MNQPVDKKNYIKPKVPLAQYETQTRLHWFTIILFIFIFFFLYKALYAYVYKVSIKNISELINFLFKPLFKVYDERSAAVLLLPFLLDVVALINSIRPKLDPQGPFKHVEQGSARFGDPKVDAKHLVEPAFAKGIITKELPYFYNPYNTILTQNLGLSINTRKTQKNNNVLVIGGSGSGKTRYFVKPNILQAFTPEMANSIPLSEGTYREAQGLSFIVTDPKGEIVRETGYFLRKLGYKIKIFDLIDMEHSSRYNPFNYFINGENDVASLVQTIIKSTNEGKEPQDPFWERAELLLDSAIMSYIYTELPKGDRNIGTVIDLLTLVGKDSGGSSGGFLGGGRRGNTLDALFDDLARQKPYSFAVRAYDAFRVVSQSEKTASSIYITATTRLRVWLEERVRQLMSEDTLELGSLGSVPTALFLVIPDSEKVYNFIVAMLYSQAFRYLYYIADRKYRGPLPLHVKFILDEFPNIGKIHEFEQYLSTVRSRNISCSIVIQDIAQLQDMYAGRAQSSWEVIPGNCSSIMYLGGGSETTAKFISELLGKTTIYSKDVTMQKNKEIGFDEALRKQARDLRTPDEVLRLPPKQAIVHIAGSFPFQDDRFELKTHPNYQYLAESSKRMFATDLRLKEEARMLLFE